MCWNAVKTSIWNTLDICWECRQATGKNIEVSIGCVCAWFDMLVGSLNSFSLSTLLHSTTQCQEVIWRWSNTATHTPSEREATILIHHNHLMDALGTKVWNSQESTSNITILGTTWCLLSISNEQWGFCCDEEFSLVIFGCSVYCCITLDLMAG